MVETSTHGAEFYALCTAAEEAIAMQHMLRSLGVKLSKGKPSVWRQFRIHPKLGEPGSIFEQKAHSFVFSQC